MFLVLRIKWVQVQGGIFLKVGLNLKICNLANWTFLIKSLLFWQMFDQNSSSTTKTEKDIEKKVMNLQLTCKFCSDQIDDSIKSIQVCI